MTPNQSLEQSNQLRKFFRADYFQGMYSVFPFEVIEQFDTSGTRDRIYSPENTILTMVYSSTQTDKTLQNSVNIFSKIHQNQSVRIINEAGAAIEREKMEDLKNVEVRRGPKKKYKVKVPKSKISEISVNTAGYSKARKRIEFELFQEIFNKTKENDSSTALWHGKRTFITDGTYVQMQDTEELRKIYNVNHNDEEHKDSYPQGLIQAIIEQGSGFIHDYTLSDRHSSELSLIYQLIKSIPKDSLLLADDLYNCYAIFALARKQGFDLIVPGKRVKNYTVLKVLAKGDEIVEIQKNEHPKWLPKSEILPAKLLLRRLSFLSPDGVTTMVIYTTWMDKNIPASEIILKYFTRWDIEITIREIKTIMDVNVLRGKTDDIVKKELISAFIAYNLIKKVIMQSTEETAFSPEKDIIQEFFENNKDILIDRKGRVYNRWSPGRYGKTEKRNP